MDACLRRLDVTAVPLLVLTHFHADHVDGLAGRVRTVARVGAIETTRLRDPPDGRRGSSTEVAGRAGLTPGPAPYGATRTRRRT